MAMVTLYKGFPFRIIYPMIEKLMKEKQINITELAKRMGVQKQAASRILSARTGIKRYIRPDVIVRMANALGVPIGELVKDCYTTRIVVDKAPRELVTLLLLPECRNKIKELFNNLPDVSAERIEQAKEELDRVTIDFSYLDPIAEAELEGRKESNSHQKG